MTTTNNESDTDKLAFSVEEAGAMLGVSRRTVYELMTSGQLISVRIGRRRLVRRQDLELFLSQLGQAA